MNVSRYTVGIFLTALFSGLIQSGCTLETSERSITESVLRRSAEIIRECSQRIGDSSPNPHDCLSHYSSKYEVPIEALDRDAFGHLLVLEPSENCDHSKFCGPYSKGPDGVDSCGLGDDIVLRSCTNPGSGLAR